MNERETHQQLGDEDALAESTYKMSELAKREMLLGGSA